MLRAFGRRWGGNEALSGSAVDSVSGAAGVTCPALGAAGSRRGPGLSSRRRPGSFTAAAMLDFFTIFSKGGLVLWCFQGVSDSCTGPVNALIRSVLLQVPPPRAQSSRLIPPIRSMVPLDRSHPVRPLRLLAGSRDCTSFSRPCLTVR